MNEKLLKFKSEIKGKRVDVIGIGVSNIPAIKYLVKLGAKVVARDKKENLSKECEALKALDVEFILGDNYLNELNSADYIFRSPGIKPFLEELEEAKKLGVIITSEIEQLVNLAPCKVVAITGSDGKTTTTSIVAKILENQGYKVWLGGNIGVPLFDKIEQIEKEDIVVLELSSFQLMTMKEQINVSGITNISPNHLNYHRDYQEYIDAKKNIYKYANIEDTIVLNEDDELTVEIKNESIQNNKYTFSIKDKVEKGVYYDLNSAQVVCNISGNLEKIIDRKEIKLQGIHNVANICMACCMTYDLCDIDTMQDTIKNFNAVEHRMEFVENIHGVSYYNDSIASSPNRTIAGLKSFEQKVILIAGGCDKNIAYDDIGEYIVEKVKTLILVGPTSSKIKEATLNYASKNNLDIDKLIDIQEFKNLKECVDYAYRTAKSGDFVVMSPASTSFDLYDNFMQRGNLFKELVRNLRNKK